MNNVLSLIMFLIFTAGISAGSEFPRGSFELADLQKAKASALTEKKDIAFIYTDKTTSCGLCQGAVAAYIGAVKSKTVIIYVNSEAKPSPLPQLPELVSQALKSGKFIPKIVVTDSNVSKVTASLTYEAYKEDNRKSIRGLRKALKAE